MSIEIIALSFTEAAPYALSTDTQAPGVRATHRGAMVNSKLRRAMKGVAVAAAATHVTHWVWTSAKRWESDAIAADPDGGFGAGFTEGMLAAASGIFLVPLLLWAGMRLLRERHNYALVGLGWVTWLVLGSKVFENHPGRMTAELTLAAFALLGGLLSLVHPDPGGRPENTSTSP